MSAEATGYVWKHSPFSGAQLLVHLAIADVVNDVHANQFWMTTSELAKKARVGRTTAVATLRELTEGGYIDQVDIGGGRGRGTVYRFRFPETGRSATSFLGAQSDRSATETGRSAHETGRFAARIDKNPITQEPNACVRVETELASPAAKARSLAAVTNLRDRLRGAPSPRVSRDDLDTRDARAERATR